MPQSTIEVGYTCLKVRLKYGVLAYLLWPLANNMLIREATTTDADAILALYASFDRPADFKPSAAKVVEVFRSLGAANGYIAVAEEDATVIATYAIYVCPNLSRGGKSFAVIENVIVASAYRRRGIGRMLMHHAKQHAKKMGCYKIMLFTGNKRIDNKVFYETCEFRADKIGFQLRL